MQGGYHKLRGQGSHAWADEHANDTSQIEPGEHSIPENHLSSELPPINNRPRVVFDEGGLLELSEMEEMDEKAEEKSQSNGEEEGLKPEQVFDFSQPLRPREELMDSL